MRHFIPTGASRGLAAAGVAFRSIRSDRDDPPNGSCVHRSDLAQEQA